MDRKELTLNQYMILLIIFVFSASLYGNIGRESGVDLWIVNLFGVLMGLLFITLHCRIGKLNNYDDFLTILQNSFGRWIGKFLTVGFALFFLYRSMVIGHTLLGVVQHTIMQSAPPTLTVIIIIVVYAYGCIRGIKVIGRSVEIIMFILMLLLLPFLFSSLLSGAFHSQTLQPILAEGVGILRKDLFRVTFFPYGEVVVFLAYLSHLARKEQKGVWRASLVGILIASVLMLAINITMFAILGANMMKMVNYPFYTAMRFATMHGLTERLDPLAVIVITYTSYFKGLLYFYAAMLLFKSVLPKVHYSWILGAMVVFRVIMAPYLTLQKIAAWEDTTIFYILPIFQLFIPFGIWIFSEINYKKSKEQKNIQTNRG